MSVNLKTVEKVARLARLKVDEKSANEMLDDMNKILGWVNQLQRVPTEGVEPMNNPVQGAAPQRDDVVTDGDYAADVLSNAPEKAHDMFAVPKVVE